MKKSLLNSERDIIFAYWKERRGISSTSRGFLFLSAVLCSKLEPLLTSCWWRSFFKWAAMIIARFLSWRRASPWAIDTKMKNIYIYPSELWWNFGFNGTISTSTFKSTMLIQEITLKLQPECLRQSQTLTSAGCKVVPMDNLSDQRPHWRLTICIWLQHNHLHPLNST